MNPSRILVIVPSFESGGTITSLINLITLVDKSRFDITVFAITNSGSNKVYISTKCKIYGEEENAISNKNSSIRRKLKTELFKTVKKTKKFLEKCGVDISPFLFKSYAGRLDKGQYDIVIAFQEGQATLLASYMKNGMKIAWVRSEYSRLVSNVGNKYNTCYESFDKIVSVSNASLQNFLTVLPQYASKAYVQYNFLNDKRILDLSKENVGDICREKCFTIITLGRIDPVKRVSEIPYICKKIRDKGIIFKWVIVGGIAVKDEYDKLICNIKKYDVGNIIEIMGNKPNPYPYLLQSDLLVSLSVSETFNNTLTEAKILGIPVVTTDYPCAYESVDNQKEGIITSFENITCKILSLIKNDNNIYSNIKKHLSGYEYDNRVLLDQLYSNILS